VLLLLLVDRSMSACHLVRPLSKQPLQMTGQAAMQLADSECI